MVSSKKIMSLKDAISKFVKDGDHITIGGATANRNPMGAVYEIIRQKKRNLHLYGHILGSGADLLIGGGCVNAVEGAYLGVGRFEPTCVRFRKAAEKREIHFEDYSNYQMGLRFLAGSVGVPYIATNSGLGSDIVNKCGFDESFRGKNLKVARKKLLIQDNPFIEGGQEKVVLLPAINPDVTILHAQKVDEEGTVRFEGLPFADIEQGKASRHLIVTTEEIVDSKYLQLHPEQNHIPPFFVDAVIHLPYGAHPTQCYNYYDYDTRFLYMIRDVSERDDRLEQFLDEYVYKIHDHTEYLEKVGFRKIESLRSSTPFGFKVGLERNLTSKE